MTTAITTTPHPPRPAPLLEVRGTFGLGDYVAPTVHAWERRHAWWQLRLSQGIPLALAVGACVLFVARLGMIVGGRLLDPPWPEFPLYEVGFAFLLLVVLPTPFWFLWKMATLGRLRGEVRWKVRRRAQRMITHGQLQIGQHCSYALSPEEFVGVVEDAESRAGSPAESRVEYRIPWATLLAVDVTEDYLFLCLPGGSFIPIPWRWFPDEKAFERFARTAREYWLGATRAPETQFHPSDPVDPEAIRPGED